MVSYALHGAGLLGDYVYGLIYRNDSVIIVSEVKGGGSGEHKRMCGKGFGA